MNILNKKAGFTLMEIMITVVIIALLAAAGIPYYKDHVERQKAALGVTNLRMIADSVERYMALHGETIPTNFTLLDADIDHSRLSSNNTRYSDGNFTFRILDSENPPRVEGRRNTNEYSLVFSLGDDSELYCVPTSRDFCVDKLGLPEHED